MRITITEHSTPLGDLRIASNASGLCALEFLERWTIAAARLERRFGAVSFEPGDPFGSSGKLNGYFAGDLPELEALPVDAGGTPFQQRVWAALREISAGETLSYSRLAARLGIPKAVRAVASAVALNPVALVIPCHRVVGNRGELRGYAGGLERKEWLLRHESAPLSPICRPLGFATLHKSDSNLFPV